MKDTYKDLIYLLSCAVNGITADKARTETMDLEKLYTLAKFHTVRAAVCISLERAEINHAEFHEAYKKAIRKNIYLDMERAAITEDFEQQGIWYMPLKGALLKELYPENGMREMSDNDVLFDAGKRKQVKDIMLAHGYSIEGENGGHHDVYMKPPVLNFELHTALFGKGHSEVFNRYYADTKRLMRLDDGSKYGYHLSDEDFYVFMTAHEYKHYSNGGTGIRLLLDCYIYCKNKGDTLDWKYIEEQCKQLEISDYENERRVLANKVFSSESFPELSENEQEMLMFYLTAGTYGTYERRIQKELNKQSKTKFILTNLFPSVGYMRNSIKFVDKCPLL